MLISSTYSLYGFLTGYTCIMDLYSLSLPYLTAREKINLTGNLSYIPCQKFIPQITTCSGIIDEYFLIVKKYLHLVLFRTLYYYQVAVWFMRPYFRRHVTLIVNTTSQYKSTPRRTVNLLLRHNDCINAFFKKAIRSQNYNITFV
jgi:hypothetical protein